VAAWTRYAAPEQFAAEIQRAVAQGYRVFKMHTCSHHDVFGQTRAAEAVARDGFKIHYDFNHGRSLGAVLQHESGTLGKAMAMHMAAVLPTHTAHSINLDDQYEEDVTTQRIPVVDGSSLVPEGIGVGYEVDESAVQQLSQQKLVEPPRHIGILT